MSGGTIRVLRQSPGVSLTNQNPHSPHLFHIVARFFQKFFRLSVPPNKVVKFVESTITMSPARLPAGGSQSKQLSSVLPAAVNGCGRLGSIGWRASTCTVFPSSLVGS